ncbi:MAG: hypothetical protein RL088_3992 [Verrucomicrobiota bacterium]|jgi:uncharacterized membrane protein YfcA
MNPILITLLIGALGGVMAALCGVGGGVVMVPAFVLLLKMSQKTAVATSLAAIVLTAMFTTAKNHVNGFVHWRTALIAGAAGALVGWLGADWLKTLSDTTLKRFFATAIIVFGVQMWISSFQK